MLKDLANKKMKENSTLQSSIQFNYLRNSQLLLKVELLWKVKEKEGDERWESTLLRYECKGHLWREIGVM